MAVRYDATTDNMSRTASLPSTSTLTVCAHAYIQVSPNPFGIVFSYDNGVAAYLQLYFDVGSPYVLTFGASGGSAAQTVLGSITTGVWYFVAMTVNGANGVGYGASMSTTAALSSVAKASINLTGVNKCWVANNGFGGGDDLNGRIANLKIWEASLSAAELEQERYFTRPQRIANLYGWYPQLDAATAATDFSGNGRNFTVGGTLATEDHAPTAWSAAVPSVYVPAAAAGAVRSRRTLEPRAGARGVPWI